MNMLKKNQIIIYTFALMLVAAGYLNYTNKINDNSVETSVEETTEQNNVEIADIGDATLVNSNDVVSNTSMQEDNSIETSSSDSNSEDYFVKSKLERETMYSQMIESYEKILNSSNSLETQKQSATQEITKINETKNSIMICENLIKTKGFKNNIVFVNGESVSVIIEAESLKQEETAQIQNIVSRELKANVENIHIATK